MTRGIHHITAIASNATENVVFYSKVLGLRLVKKTVNQDDTETYHLFFGDRVGHPGMDLTFFIFQPSMPGKRGNGLVTTISLAVPEKSMEFWQARLVKHHVKSEEISERFGRPRILFFDHDDQQLELVGVPAGDLEKSPDVWKTKEISVTHAIRHFYSATLSVISHTTVEPILTRVFGYEHVDSHEHIHLYKTNGSKRAHLLEVSEQPSAAAGFNAAGTVHHIAFRSENEKEQMEMRRRVEKRGLYPTEVIDRFYFKSVYFRTPAGILFEIATDKPGFTADESEKHLGKSLALPPFLEPQREIIEDHLPLIEIE